MEAVAPVGPVFQAGTLSGNPLATAAGLAVLDLLDAAAYDSLRAKASKLRGLFEAAFTDAGVEACVPQVSTLLGIHFGPTLPTNYDEARTTDEAAFARFFHGMLDRGVAMAPGAYEVMFLGLAHTDADIEAIGAAAAGAAADLR
jgi:glutamate-1-semialdehyde 2,1-aminomutase